MYLPNRVSVTPLVLLLLVIFLPSFTSSIPVYDEELQPFPEEKRAVTSETDSVEEDEETTVKPLAINPFIPFLKIRPVLPIKPAFFPPLVDPSLFIDKKFDLLGNMFSGTGVVGSKAAVIPITKPYIPPFGYFGPYLGLKKATLLAAPMYDQISPSDSPSKRKVGEENDYIDPENESPINRRLVLGPPFSWTPENETESSSTPLPPFWMSFASSKLTPTPKPTIVPPGFWLPFAAAKTATKMSPFTKATSVPPNVWAPFMTDGAPPTPKPSIVPPGFWLPFSGSSPAIGPMVDPTMMMSKKAKFLDTLFKSLTTSAPMSARAVSMATTPKPTRASRLSKASTTTPPSSFVSDPEYDEKVSAFLDKLFNSLKPTPSTPEPAKSAVTFPGGMSFFDALNKYSDTSNGDSFVSVKKRSISDPSASVTPSVGDSLLTAKDRVIANIVTELSGIKDNMVDTFAEMIQKQKDSTTAPVSTASKKPMSPYAAMYASPYAALWNPTPAPTPDPTLPFQDRLSILAQVFDILTKLQKDVTVAVDEAANEGAQAAVQNTTALLQAIHQIHLANATPPMHQSTPMDAMMKNMMAILENPTTTPPPQTLTPEVLVKLLSRLSQPSLDKVARSLKLAVHQGYQNTPPQKEGYQTPTRGWQNQRYDTKDQNLQNELPAPYSYQNYEQQYEIPERKKHHHHHRHEY